MVQATAALAGFGYLLGQFLPHGAEERAAYFRLKAATPYAVQFGGNGVVVKIVAERLAGEGTLYHRIERSDSSHGAVVAEDVYAAAHKVFVS